MKLRIAKKIRKAIGCPRGGAYSEGKKLAALDRIERTRSCRSDRKFFAATMKFLGVRGRAELLARTGAPGMALDLLMRTPEREWTYGTGGPPDPHEE